MEKKLERIELQGSHDGKNWMVVATQFLNPIKVEGIWNGEHLFLHIRKVEHFSDGTQRIVA